MYFDVQLGTAKSFLGIIISFRFDYTMLDSNYEKNDIHSSKINPSLNNFR